MRKSGLLIIVTLLLSYSIAFAKGESITTQKSSISYDSSLSQSEAKLIGGIIGISIKCMPGTNEMLQDKDYEIKIFKPNDLDKAWQESCKETGSTDEQYDLASKQTKGLRGGFTSAKKINDKIIFSIYIDKSVMEKINWPMPYVLITHEIGHIIYHRQLLEDDQAGKKVDYDKIDDEIRTYDLCLKTLDNYFVVRKADNIKVMGQENYDFLMSRLNPLLDDQKAMRAKWQAYKDQNR